MSNDIKRVTGLLVIEAVNSNPNGNPDADSDPRQRDNGQGEISPVSFKRKLRDLIEISDGPVFQTLLKPQEKDGKTIYSGLSSEIPDGYQFCILESRGRDRKAIFKEMGPKESFIESNYENSVFVKKYWDARIFGNTFLESKDSGDSDSGKPRNKGYIKTGIVQFGMGISVCPVIIQRHTNTNKAGVQEGKNQGMAPLAYRVVEHGVYVMPFFINPSLAAKSGCKLCDVELLWRLIPYAYDHTRSAIRPDVRIRHAWWIEHKDALGSCPDHLLIDALTPKRKGDDPLAPSTSWDDYHVPSALPDGLNGKVAARDLMEL